MFLFKYLEGTKLCLWVCLYSTHCQCKNSDNYVSISEDLVNKNMEIDAQVFHHPCSHVTTELCVCFQYSAVWRHEDHSYQILVFSLIPCGHIFLASLNLSTILWTVDNDIHKFFAILCWEVFLHPVKGSKGRGWERYSLYKPCETNCNLWFWDIQIKSH